MHDDVQLQILSGPGGLLVGLTSRGARVRSVPATTIVLPALPPADGAALWRALPEPVRQALLSLHRRDAAEPLPLWIDIQAPDLIAWPWERLAPDTPGALPFSLLPGAPLVRFLAAGPAPAIRAGVPRLLAVAAAPRDQAPLDLAPLRTLVKRLHHPGRIATIWRERCSPDELRRLLAARGPDILLILAHGEPGAIVLEDAGGDSVPLPAAELAALLAGTPVRAVLLASCDGATVCEDTRSTAETLLAAGALGVVAMAGPISMDGVELFLDGLLEAVAAGHVLEGAVVAGRKALVGRQGLNGEWATPVCWQQALHRPLALTPPEVVRRGATTLTRRAGSWAKQLAAGGALGLLAVASLQPLLAPLLAGGATTIALPALLGLLHDLGLNVFAGYLGAALGKVWQATGGPVVATPDEIAQALQIVVGQHDDAARQIADLARSSGAMAQVLDAIRADTTGSRALLAGLDRDLDRHGAALADLGDELRSELAGLSADIRQGFTAIFRQGERVAGTLEEVRATSVRTERKVDDLRATHAGEQQERAAHEREQRDDYLRAVVTTYQSLQLARLVERGMDQPPELYLQHVYTQLTTGRWLNARQRRTTWTAAEARRFQTGAGAGRAPNAAPPGRVRRLEHRLPDDSHPAHRSRRDSQDLLADMLAIAGADRWTVSEIPENVPPETRLQARLSRPELVVETFGPRADGRPRRLVLLGEPGSGKSTALRYTAVLLAQALLAGRPATLAGWPTPRLPILVQLGAFRIARYPVTVWQFRQFWHDPAGYENQAYWTPQGWAWKKSEPETKQPYLWDDPDWTAANQPVVGVSWYEASAFCAWLTQAGREAGWLPADQLIRLPTEAEWEVAAMWDGATGQMRPWAPPAGELWQNVEEAGIGRTCPVGLFPQGASPCGALDMAGNAWEWCASDYEDYPANADNLGDDFPAGRFRPALRGGAYYLQNERSGWGARNRNNPDNQNNNRSFRVAVWASCGRRLAGASASRRRRRGTRGARARPGPGLAAGQANTNGLPRTSSGACHDRPG